MPVLFAVRNSERERVGRRGGSDLLRPRWLACGREATGRIYDFSTPESAFCGVKRGYF